MTNLETIDEENIMNNEMINYNYKQSKKIYRLLYCSVSCVIIFITIIICILFNK